MNEIKTATIHFSGIASKERILKLKEKFEKYINKSYDIIAKEVPNLEGEAALRKNLQILYFIKQKNEK